MRKVLLTGASGFVGSFLLDRLLSLGFFTIILLRAESDRGRFRDLSERFSSLLSIEFVDWLNPSDDLCDLVCGVDYIIHCGGVLRALDFSSYYNGNVVPVRVLGECAKGSVRLRHFIYVSSQAAAGPSFSEDCVKTELDSCLPVSAYGKSKLLGEEELARYRGLFRISILRPCAIYGPRDFEFYPVFRLVRFGFGFLIGSGKQKVNLIYIKDFVELVLHLMFSEFSEFSEFDKGKRDFSIYFANDGRVYDWRLIYELVGDIVGRKPFFISLPAVLARLFAYINGFVSRVRGRPGILSVEKLDELLCDFWLCSSDKFERDFSFSARYSLHEGFSEAYEWYKEQSYL